METLSYSIGIAPPPAFTPKLISTLGQASMQREAWRQFLHGSVEPLSQTVSAEFSAKLDSVRCALSGFRRAHGCASVLAKIVAMKNLAIAFLTLALCLGTQPTQAQRSIEEMKEDINENYHRAITGMTKKFVKDANKVCAALLADEEFQTLEECLNLYTRLESYKGLCAGLAYAWEQIYELDTDSGFRYYGRKTLKEADRIMIAGGVPACPERD